MLKVITLRCPGCGNTYDFNIGADSKLKNWYDALAKISDKKEVERLQDAYTKVIENKTKPAATEFSINAADALNNVQYALCGEETVKLVDEIPDETADAIFSEKVMESADASQAKWAESFKKDGITAFEAVYICPKSHHPKQGLHLSLHWKDDKGNMKTFVARNSCDDCSAKLTLANDGNLGFMHEGCATVARCENCNGILAVDKVSFKIPTEENPAD